MPKSRFFTLRDTYVNCATISVDVIQPIYRLLRDLWMVATQSSRHSFDRKSAIEHDSGV